MVYETRKKFIQPRRKKNIVSSTGPLRTGLEINFNRQMTIIENKIVATV